MPHNKWQVDLRLIHPPAYDFCNISYRKSSRRKWAGAKTWKINSKNFKRLSQAICKAVPYFVSFTKSVNQYDRFALP